jgi:hypothetical protein
MHPAVGLVITADYKITKYQRWKGWESIGIRADEKTEISDSTGVLGPLSISSGCFQVLSYLYIDWPDVLTSSW